MAGGGGFAISRSQNGDDRFYNALAMRRQPQNNHQQQQLVLQQQQHQQIQRHHQLLLQQQQQIQQFQRPPPPPVADASAGIHAAENRVVADDSRPTLPMPPAFLTPPPPENVILPPPLQPQPNATNLDRFLESVSPTVPANFLYEVSSRGWKSLGAELHPFYSLGVLWESFREWSVYGAGVPLILNDQDSIVQYYVPYLSGMQLYVDPLKPLPRLSFQYVIGELCYAIVDAFVREVALVGKVGNSKGWPSEKWVLKARGRPGVESEVVDNSPSNQAAVSNPPGCLVFEYLEHDQPHLRQPLTDKILVLESQFPELRMYKSYELLPSSWLCVAWYPIYRIPVGPTLKDLEASFLTFHSLSANFRSTQSSQPSASCSVANGQKVKAAISPSHNVTLPAFGLASYKLKDSLMTPCGPHECEQENALLQAAGDWLNRLQVILPDYQFFISHYSKWR